MCGEPLDKRKLEHRCHRHGQCCPTAFRQETMDQWKARAAMLDRMERECIGTAVRGVVDATSVNFLLSFACDPVSV